MAVRAVPPVVVCQGPALARFERQPQLGSVQGLDLGLLVDGRHQRVGGRVHVEADHVLHLGCKGRIGGSLEGPRPMRLEAMNRPDALDRAQRHAHGLGHRAAGPVGGLPRRLRAKTLATVAVVRGFLPGGRVLSHRRPSTPSRA